MSNNLAESFNTEDVDLIEIKTFKDILKDINDQPNPTKLVTAAIEKASIFIDMIHTESVNGEMSPRYMEVAAGLINTIIQSSGFLSNETQLIFENQLKTIGVSQKNREIDIKQQEVDIKEIYYNTKKIGNDNSNIIITDYNSILNFIENKNEDVEENINPVK